MFVAGQTVTAGEMDAELGVTAFLAGQKVREAELDPAFPTRTPVRAQDLNDTFSGGATTPPSGGGGGGGGGTPGQTLGIGGVATPAGAILTTADSTDTLVISTSGTVGARRVYDGQGFTVKAIDLQADYVTVQNFRIRGANNAGIYSEGTGNIIQNNDIAEVAENGTGDINAITFFGDDTIIQYNQIGPDLVLGSANGAHTDAIQTWNTPSKRSSSNVLIFKNRIEGPTSTTDDDYIHQGVMAEGKDSTDGGGGGTGVSSGWLIDSNYFKTGGNQCIKVDDIDNVEITRNTFDGVCTHVIESTALSSGTKFYSDNIITGTYGDIGVPITPGSGSGPAPTTAAPTAFPDGTAFAFPTGGADYTPTTGTNTVSNRTIRNYTVPTGGLILKNCVNVIVDMATMNFQQEGDIIQIDGGSRIMFRNADLGPASQPGGTWSGATCQYVYVKNAADHIYFERCRVKFKTSSGNGIKVYGVFGDAAYKGGVTHVLYRYCEFADIGPFDENDHEPLRHGVSTMQYTDTHSMALFCRWARCQSEPEPASIKMCKFWIWGCTFEDCIGGPTLRHGNFSKIQHCHMKGNIEVTASSVRCTSGGRIYGKGHEYSNNTIWVMEGLPTRNYERPFLLDYGDQSVTALGNGHANIEDALIKDNLFYRCGDGGGPIFVGKNYSNPPSGTITGNIAVECPTPGTQLVSAVNLADLTGLTMSDNTAYDTASAAGVTFDSNGVPRHASKGAQVPYLTASMVGPGSTWTYTADSGTTPPPPSNDTTQAAVRYGWGDPLPESDEFDYVGPPDSSKWDLPGLDWPGHDGNGRRRPERQTVDGSKLIMTGLANGDSGWMAHVLNRQYGRYEARVRAYNTATSNGNLYSPVLLIWPTSDSRKADGEYDYYEPGEPGSSTLTGFMHFPGDGDQQREFTKSGSVDLSQFHNIAFEWTSSGLKGFIDGEQWFSTSGGADGTRDNIQDMPSGFATIQLDNFDGTNQTPATFECEWFRVYAL